MIFTNGIPSDADYLVVPPYTPQIFYSTSVYLSASTQTMKMGRILLIAIVSLLAADVAHAGSATWNLNPADDDWINSNNWTPATVPNGPADTATFGVSNNSIISLTIPIELAEMIFQPGASAYVIGTAPYGAVLTMSGAGVTNNSGISQIIATLPTFVGPGGIVFTNSASAGSQMTYTNNGVSFGDPPEIDFLDSSSAGSGTFTNSGSFAAGVGGSLVAFADTSTAGQATLINNGSNTAGGLGGVTRFTGTSDGGSATLIANGGTGGGGGGRIEFLEFAEGSGARVELFDNGTLDVSSAQAPGATVGSLEGSGDVMLGSNNLSVGTTNRNTTFSGVIQDDGISGQLTKFGTGTLILSGRNTYVGPTNINAGSLLVTSRLGSGNSHGVKANIGTFGGTGTISGSVTVGKRTGPGAILSPGINGLGTLTIKRTLTFNPDGSYKFELNSNTARADKVVAGGVAIPMGGRFSFVDLGSGILTVGTTFVVIDNKASTPISGNFRNLEDGSTFTAGSNTFLVDYEGGDGNDLTLIVQ